MGVEEAKARKVTFHFEDSDEQKQQARKQLDIWIAEGFNRQVREAQEKLDGTTESAVALVADVPREDLPQYGGMQHGCDGPGGPAMVN